MHRSFAFGLLTGAALMAALAVLTFAAGSGAAAKRGTIIASTVMADQFILGGEPGQALAIIGREADGSPSIVLADRDRKPRLMLSLAGPEAAPRIALVNAEGFAQVVTELKGEEPVMSMVNRDNNSQLVITINRKTGAYFSILDQTGLRAGQAAQSVRDEGR